ncbi:MAG: biotin/lipoyl-containing protein [Christensenellales bacterium]|jgi:biotin carboxyl carrier protein|nr:biotin/lipoyl-binding protein [Clostridia bacterium]HRU84109.1 biotin/lipoyl-binding protein [Eubacteriales bacterium]
MRKFNVNVNGKAYSVEIEEVFENNNTEEIKPAAVVKPAAPVAPAPKAAPAAPKAAVSGKTDIKCPMPGTITALKAADGKAVKKGEVIAVLEAMKLENDIVSPADGVITYAVKKGDMLKSGDIIAVLN